MDLSDSGGMSIDFVVDDGNLLPNGCDLCINFCDFLFQGCSFNDEGIHLLVILSLEENQLGDDVGDHLICNCLPVEEVFDVFLFVSWDSS